MIQNRLNQIESIGNGFLSLLVGMIVVCMCVLFTIIILYEDASGVIDSG